MPQEITSEAVELKVTDVALLKEGDPFFADHKPDPFKAYVRLQFGHSLPVVCLPEMISGDEFGLHPAVVAKHFRSALHQQTNLGHRLKVLGAPRDRICGCLVQLGFPDEPAGGWVIPATEAEAPAISAVAVIWKRAEGVEALIGQYMAGSKPWAVSMEMNFSHAETGIWDPTSNEVYDRGEIPPVLRQQVFEDSSGKLAIRQGSKLVKVHGGRSGTLWFSGLGYVNHGAVKQATIDEIAASRGDDGMLCASLREPEWFPGLPVRWSSVGGMWGRGHIIEACFDGEVTCNRKTLKASDQDPVLSIRLPDGRMVARHASWVKKNS